ncbi:MAG: type II toxin-antitoxin system VapB family antitoxin [Solirubrobacterales bacterium]
MKTTVEIRDELIERARALNEQHGTTLRELVEAGLDREIESRSREPEFTLRDCSFGGNGLSREFAGAGWEKLRAAAYEDHGA